MCTLLLLPTKSVAYQLEMIKMAFRGVKLSNFRTMNFKCLSFFTPGKAHAIEKTLPWIQNKSGEN